MAEFQETMDKASAMLSYCDITEANMIKPHKADERGYAHHGWLESRHRFSFADYRAPVHIRFGPLRVINEDMCGPAPASARAGIATWKS